MRTGNTAAAIKASVGTPAVVVILQAPGLRRLEVHGWHSAVSRIPWNTRVFVRFARDVRHSDMEVEILSRMRRSADR